MDISTPVAAPVEAPSPVNEATEPVAPKEPEKKEAKPPTAAEIRRHKLKIDDQEIEVDDEELKAGYALRKSSTKRFEEAAALKKQMDAEKKMAKENPRAYLKSLGLDPRTLSEELLWEDIQEESMTPEQKKLKAYEAKIAEYEAQKRELEEQKRQQHIDELTAKESERYEKELISALETSKLPRNANTVKLIVREMKEAIDHGYEISANEAARLVRKNFEQFHKENIQSADGDFLAEYVGEETLAKIREADVKRLKGSFNKPMGQRQPSEPVETDSKPKQKMSWSEWQDELARRARGGR